MSAPRSCVRGAGSPSPMLLGLRSATFRFNATLSWRPARGRRGRAAAGQEPATLLRCVVAAEPGPPARCFGRRFLRVALLPQAGPSVCSAV